MNSNENTFFFFFLCMFFQLHLVARVDRSVSCQQQRHDVHVALLRRQMQRGDALPRHAVGGCAVFQQRGGNLQLVLLGSDVQRRVAVLDRERTISTD